MMTPYQRYMFRFLRSYDVPRLEETIRLCLKKRHCPINGDYMRRWGRIHLRFLRTLRRFLASSLVQQHQYVIGLGLHR